LFVLARESTRNESENEEMSTREKESGRLAWLVFVVVVVVVVVAVEWESKGQT